MLHGGWQMSLLSHPGFESVCLNSWVLTTAAIGLKTKQNKAFNTLFAEGNTTDTWDSGKPQKLELERGNSRVWNHPFLAASAAKKFTHDQNFVTGHQRGNNYIQDYVTVMYISHSQINVKFDFCPKQLHWQKIQTTFLPIADFSSWLLLP